jgi:hypothetical protein
MNILFPIKMKILLVKTNNIVNIEIITSLSESFKSCKVS